MARPQPAGARRQHVPLARLAEPWWTQWGAGRELQLVCVREGGQLIGFLPLFSEQVRLGGVSVRRLAFVGDGETGCDYLDVLAAPGREREVFELCLQAVQDLNWDLCDLDGLWRESYTAREPRASAFPTRRPSRPGSRRPASLRLPAHPAAGNLRRPLSGLEPPREPEAAREVDLQAARHLHRVRAHAGRSGQGHRAFPAAAQSALGGGRRLRRRLRREARGLPPRGHRSPRPQRQPAPLHPVLRAQAGGFGVRRRPSGEVQLLPIRI